MEQWYDEETWEVTWQRPESLSPSALKEVISLQERINRCGPPGVTFSIVACRFGFCDHCDREEKLLCRLRFYYTETQVLPSWLLSSDLYRWHWGQPLCGHCLSVWLLAHTWLWQQTEQAVQRLQRWWRRRLYQPPCAAQPLGGREYRRAHDQFMQRMEAWTL